MTICPRIIVTALLAVGSSSLHAQTGWSGVWLFDEGAGLTTADISPFGNAGTLTNFSASQTYWVAGQNGTSSAIEYDGIDDYVEFTTNGGVPIYRGDGAPFSVCFWVKAPPQDDDRVYSEGNSQQTTLGGALFTIGTGRASLSNEDKLQIYIRNDSQSGIVDMYSATTVFDDTWHHVCYVDNCGDARVYVDGVLDSASFDYRTAAGGPQSNTYGPFSLDKVSLGAVVRNNAVAHLQGAIDELRIFSFALSAAEVNNVFTTGFPSQCSASIGEFGLGCSGTPFDLVASGSAMIGGPGVNLGAVNGTPGAIAVLAADLGAIAPIDLAVLGAPGCTFYPATSNNLFVAGVLDAAGAVTYPTITIPNNAALECGRANWQFVSLTFTGGLGIDVTDAAITTFGF